MLKISAATVQDLYPRILGESWNELAEQIRMAHTVLTERRGCFKVTHGGNFLTRMLIRLSRLPRHAESTEVTLHIHPHCDGEKWKRCFGTDELVTVQRTSGGHLIESFGKWDLQFSLRVSDTALNYDQCGARLCLGPLRLPVPQFFAPRVRAREEANGPNQVRVHVTVSLPCLGTLITYDGYLAVNDPT